VNRLRTYHTNVDSVLDYYRDILVEVRLHICYCFHGFPWPHTSRTAIGSGQLVVLSKSKCASDGNGAAVVTSCPHGSMLPRRLMAPGTWTASLQTSTPRLTRLRPRCQRRRQQPEHMQLMLHVKCSGSSTVTRAQAHVMLSASDQVMPQHQAVPQDVHAPFKLFVSCHFVFCSSPRMLWLERLPNALAASRKLNASNCRFGCIRHAIYDSAKTFGPIKQRA